MVHTRTGTFVVAILLLLSSLCASGAARSASADTIHGDLIRAIVSGHRVLESSIEAVSGEIACDHKKADETRSARVQFAKSKGRVWLKYLRRPPDSEDDRGPVPATEILLRAGGYDYVYRAGPASSSRATLYRSQAPDPDTSIRLENDFFHWLNALFANPNSQVAELLQRPIERVESKPYAGATDALWITGEEAVSESGTAMQWTLVLNPAQHYAILRYELSSKNEDTGFWLTSSRDVDSQVVDDNTVLPQSIVNRTEGSAWPTEESVCRVILESVGAEEEERFNEASFVKLGRDVVIVDVLDDGRQVVRETVRAAPSHPGAAASPEDGIARRGHGAARLLLAAASAMILSLMVVYAVWRR